MEYIETCESQDDGCIFCDKPAENKDQANLILHRGSQSFVIMNRFPYNNGHLMVVPYRHTSDLASLTPGEKEEVFDLLITCQNVLKSVMRPHGYNIGMNLGQIAGAGIADHLHFHILPRWSGDTNFMPVLGHAKVVSEGLERTWMKLHQAFQSK